MVPDPSRASYSCDRRDRRHIAWQQWQANKVKLMLDGADFLFGSEISAHLDEIVKHALASWRVHTEYRDYTQTPPPGYDHKRVVDGMHERSVWFTNQHEIAKEKFRQYWM